MLVIDNYRGQPLQFASAGAKGFDAFLDAVIVDAAGRRVSKPWDSRAVQSYFAEKKVWKVVRPHVTELTLDNPFLYMFGDILDVLRPEDYSIRFSLLLPDGPVIHTNWLRVAVRKHDLEAYREDRESRRYRTLDGRVAPVTAEKKR